MKRAAGIALALLGAFAIGPALAQLFSPSQFYPAAVVAYTGPGDVVSGANGWWGLRAYNAAYATGSNSAGTLRRASDNATQAIVILSNGKFDTASASTFCNATTCSFTTLNDQSGGGHNASQGTAATQPTLKFNCIGSLPCMQLNGSQNFGAVTISALSQPITYSTTAERTANVNFDSLLSAFSGAAGAAVQGNSTTGNSWRGYAGNVVTFSPSDNAAHAVQVVFNSTASAINLDGTDTASVNLGTQAGQTAIRIGADVSGGGGGMWNGYIMETGYWNNESFTATQRGNVCHNQFAYWGTATSC